MVYTFSDWILDKCWYFTRALRCLVYDVHQWPTKPKYLIEIATLSPANGEATDDALEEAISSNLKSAPSSKINPVGFNNCLDFAVEAVRRLNTACYVSAEDTLGLRQLKPLSAHWFAQKPMRTSFQTANEAPVAVATRPRVQGSQRKEDSQ